MTTAITAIAAAMAASKAAGPIATTGITAAMATMTTIGPIRRTAAITPIAITAKIRAMANIG
jgi:hypothetical protein